MAPRRPSGAERIGLAVALGLALFENGWKVLVTRTPDLVRTMQEARPRTPGERRVARRAGNTAIDPVPHTRL